MRGVARLGLGQRGFALLVVLWTMVLLALMVTQLTASSRQESQIASNLRANAMLQEAASGAVQEAAFHLLDQSAAHWLPDGSIHLSRLPGIVTSIRIEDESGKVNPNTASPDLLQALLRRIGVDAARAALLAAAITDWHTPGNQARPVSALQAAYTAAGRDYAPPGAAFETPGELGLVLGMTPEILARLLPHLTLFTDGDPDPRAADPVVAMALRDLRGDTGSASGPSSGNTIVVVTATSIGTGAAAGRVVRRATLSIGEDVDGSLFRVLSWDTGRG
jgi:general secretion pathway protein K